MNGENTFKKDRDENDFSDEYFLKLAPDFSVLNLAEKFGSTDIEKNGLINGKISDINEKKCYRVMFKTERYIIRPSNITNSTTVKVFKLPDGFVYICINHNDPISFSNDCNDIDIIGAIF